MAISRLKMVTRLMILSCLGLIISHVQASVVLTEQSLVELVNKDTPAIAQIKAKFLQSALVLEQIEDRFAPHFYSQGQYETTEAKPIIPYIPIFSPVISAESGIRKAFPKGATVQAGLGFSQSSAPELANDATTATAAVTIQMDLWRNLWGRLTEAQISSATFVKERAELEKVLEEKAFLIGIRKLYWSLVANNEALKISQKLYQDAQTQAADARRRLRNFVADKGEVARYEAQVAARRGSLTYLKYVKQGLMKQLMEMLPPLAGQEVELGAYDLDQTLNSVLKCTQKIAQVGNAPLDYTPYDEMVSLLKRELVSQKIVAESYDDPEFNLFTTLKTTGVNNPAPGGEGTLSGAYEDIRNHDRSGLQVGVELVIPLGGKKKQTATTQEILQEKRILSQWEQMQARVEASHQQFKKNILLLGDVIETQKESSLKLGMSLTEMRKKFRQARISVNELVNDQDALLQTDLSLIDTQLQVLNTLLDYFLVFPETPCDVNKVTL